MTRPGDTPTAASASAPSPAAPADPARSPRPAAGPMASGRFLEDLRGALVWPGLLRAAGLALRPARMVMAFLLLLTVALLVQLADLWILRGHHADGAVRGLGEIVQDQLTVTLGHVSSRQWPQGLLSLVMLPARMFREHPLATLALAAPVAAAWAVLGGAIGRTAATEFARHERTGWSDALSLSLKRWWTQSLSLLLPLAFAGVLAAALAVLGRVLLGYSVTSVVGGALFGAGALAGMFIVLTLVVFVLALPMLVPAVLIEGTDAIDSIQRSSAYVVAQPVRLVLYAGLLAVQMLLVTAVITAVVKGAFFVTGSLTAMFLHEPYGALVRQEAFSASGPTLGMDAGEYPAWQLRAGGLIGFWHRLFKVLPLVYAVSFFFSAGSVLYLSMRRVCDGQDPGELWKPSDDRASASRARAVSGEDEL